MKPLFADTFYFLALLDRRDASHGRVLQFAATNRQIVVTTRWVLAEAANAISALPVRSAVARLLQQLERDESVRIVHATDDLFDRGLELFLARRDKEWSLTDCISFIVMSDEELRDVLTGDRHFEQAGFRPLFA